MKIRACRESAARRNVQKGVSHPKGTLPGPRNTHVGLVVLVLQLDELLVERA
jgi:hypothetical protein